MAQPQWRRNWIDLAVAQDLRWITRQHLPDATANEAQERNVSKARTSRLNPLPLRGCDIVDSTRGCSRPVLEINRRDLYHRRRRGPFLGVM